MKIANVCNVLITHMHMKAYGVYAYMNTQYYIQFLLIKQ